MNRTLLFITALSVLIFMSCQSSKKNNTERQNEVELVAETAGLPFRRTDLLLKHIHISI